MKKIPYAGWEGQQRKRGIDARRASELRASGKSWREVTDEVSFGDHQFAIDSVMSAVRKYREGIA